jgi:hypothetical protein
MARFLKQSTAFTFRIGPFVDSTDGVTAETALSIAQADIQISKAGGAFAQTSAASPTTTHDADGWYQCPLTTTDTGTVGTLTVQIIIAGALPVWEHFMVLPANVYDSLMGTDLLDVSVTQWLGTAAATPTVAGVPEVDVTHWIGTAAATPTVAGVPEVDVTHWIGTAAATPTVAGVPEVDVTHWNGTAVATPDTAGYPKTTVKSGTGTGEISLSSGRVAVQTGIRKNTALANFPFLMTDSTNHNPATGLTVTGTRSIDGGAFGAGTIANMTEVASGVYQCDLGAGDLNGDTIILRFTASGADDLLITLVPMV